MGALTSVCQSPAGLPVCTRVLYTLITLVPNCDLQLFLFFWRTLQEISVHRAHNGFLQRSAVKSLVLLCTVKVHWCNAKRHKTIYILYIYSNILLPSTKKWNWHYLFITEGLQPHQPHRVTSGLSLTETNKFPTSWARQDKRHQQTRSDCTHFAPCMH